MGEGGRNSFDRQRAVRFRVRVISQARSLELEREASSYRSTVKDRWLPPIRSCAPVILTRELASALARWGGLEHSGAPRRGTCFTIARAADRFSPADWKEQLE